jgi:hypothetical protein
MEKANPPAISKYRREGYCLQNNFKEATWYSFPIRMTLPARDCTDNPSYSSEGYAEGANCQDDERDALKRRKNVVTPLA